MAIMIKVHESYRKIIAVCDSDLLGKKFTEGNLQLDLRESFYGGEEVDEEKAAEMMRYEMAEDATFNIVGKESIKAAIKAGIIEDSEESIIRIKGIPHALGLM